VTKGIIDQSQTEVLTGAVVSFVTFIISHFWHAVPSAPPADTATSANKGPILALLFALALLPASAQTNTVASVPNLITNAPGFTLASLFSGGFGAGLQQGAQDLISFVEKTPTTNGVLTLEGGALYATSTKKVGGFFDAYLPVGGTNSVFGAGFGLAYLDGNFYDATINARLGDQITIPFINVPLYAYVESGGGYNLGKMEIMSQAFTGALFKIPITSNSTLTLGGAIGSISDYSGNIYALGGSYTLTW
jgi:hypothetical protein